MRRFPAIRHRDSAGGRFSRQPMDRFNYGLFGVISDWTRSHLIPPLRFVAGL